MAVYTSYCRHPPDLPPQHYGEWRALFENQPMRVATFCSFISLFWIVDRCARHPHGHTSKPTSCVLGLEILVASAPGRTPLGDSDSLDS